MGCTYWGARLLSGLYIHARHFFVFVSLCVCVLVFVRVLFLFASPRLEALLGSTPFDLDRELVLEVWDYDANSAHDLIGVAAALSPRRLLDAFQASKIWVRGTQANARANAIAGRAQTLAIVKGHTHTHKPLCLSAVREARARVVREASSSQRARSSQVFPITLEKFRKKPHYVNSGFVVVERAELRPDPKSIWAQAGPTVEPPPRLLSKRGDPFSWNPPFLDRINF